MLTSTTTVVPSQSMVLPKSKPKPKAIARPKHGILQRLIDAGYRWGPPPRISISIMLQDEAFCRRSRCHICRKRRLKYIPLSRGNEYAAAAECAKCMKALRLPVAFGELAGPGQCGSVVVIDEYGAEVEVA